MKYILSFLLVFTLLLSIEAQDSGIQFYKGDWESTLSQAQKENKIIFVDAYTSWCGPCKYMSANVFPEKIVGDYYNKNFINVKIDMEKGEGIQFAKKYEVMAYPTLLFIDHKGKMVHKGLGGRAAEDFVSLGEAASDPNQQIGTMQTKFESGNRDVKFLKNYATALTSAGMGGAADVASEYLNGQSDWNTRENMAFIFEMADWNNMDDKLYQHVAKNKAIFDQAMGVDEVNMRLKNGAYRRAASIPNVTRKQIESVFNQIFPNNYKQYSDEFQMNLLGRSDINAYMNAAVDYIGRYDITDSNLLNDIAWTFYENSNDRTQLTLAKGWAKKSVSQDKNYMNMDTLAALCYKLKEKKSAKKYAKKAIRMARKNGEDATETMVLLDKILAL